MAIGNPERIIRGAFPKILSGDLTNQEYRGSLRPPTQGMWRAAAHSPAIALLIKYFESIFQKNIKLGND